MALSSLLKPDACPPPSAPPSPGAQPGGSTGPTDTAARGIDRRVRLDGLLCWARGPMLWQRCCRGSEGRRDPRHQMPAPSLLSLPRPSLPLSFPPARGPQARCLDALSYC